MKSAVHENSTTTGRAPGRPRGSRGCRFASCSASVSRKALFGRDQKPEPLGLEDLGEQPDGDDGLSCAWAAVDDEHLPLGGRRHAGDRMPDDLEGLVLGTSSSSNSSLPSSMRAHAFDERRRRDEPPLLEQVEHVVPGAVPDVLLDVEAESASASSARKRCRDSPMMWR
jgi:hypothetical protein